MVEYGDFVRDTLIVLGVSRIECVSDAKSANSKTSHAYIHVCTDIAECYCSIPIIFPINL